MISDRNIGFSAEFVPSDTDGGKNIADMRPKKKRNKYWGWDWG